MTCRSVNITETQLQRYKHVNNMHFTYICLNPMLQQITSLTLSHTIH